MRRRAARAVALTAVAWCTTAPAPARAERVERLAIVDRAIDLHGGELYRSSETELVLCSGSGCYQVRARVDGGLYEYQVSGPTSRGHREVRADNDSIEWWLEGQPQAVDADLEVGLRNWVMARVYYCFLPYRLNDPGVWKEDLGLVEWEGRRLHKVKVTFGAVVGGEPQDEYMYWLDPQTGRVEAFAYSYTSGGSGLRFRRAFNHRRIGGLLFFDQENMGVEGEGLSVDRIDPGFVADRMRPVSTVELREIRVSPLDR